MARRPAFLLPRSSRDALHAAQGAASKLLRLFAEHYGVLGAGVLASVSGQGYEVALFMQRSMNLGLPVPRQLNGVRVRVCRLGRGVGHETRSGI